MRNATTNKFLNDMTKEQKIERTSPVALRERGLVIKEYNNWLLCRNEFPHDDRGKTQLVLWAKHRGKKKTLYSRQFYHILAEYNEFTITRHAIQDKTIPFREHRHIYN